MWNKSVVKNIKIMYTSISNKGKVLDMNILEFLTPKTETSFLESDSTIRQALEKYDYHKFSVVPVIDKYGHFVCTISEGDILRFIKNNCHFDIKLAEETRIDSLEKYRPYQPLDINCSIEDVIRLSFDQNFIPMVDDRGMYIGIVKRKAIIQYFYDNKEEVERKIKR